MNYHLQKINQNYLLKEKIKNDPLNRSYVESFYQNNIEKIIIDNDLKNLGEISSVIDPSLTGYFLLLFQSQFYNKQKFVIKLNLDSHKEELFWQDKEYGNNLDLFIGSTLIHECAHPKYHLWAVLDEMDTSSPGYWHTILDEEAQRFTLENKNFVTGLVDKLIFNSSKHF